MKYKELASARTFLEIDMHGKPADKRLRVCVLMLLWEVACSDQQVTKDEFLKIIRQACFEFHIMDEEAEEILEIAACLDSERKHFDKFIGEINQRLDREQREYFYSLMVEIAKADGHFNFEEKTYLSILRQKLNLTLKD